MSSKKTRVVILGSKPGADIPEGDAIWCANGAIGFYAGEVSRFSRVVSVLNPDVIHPKTRRQGVLDRERNEQQYRMILASKPDKMMLTRTSGLDLRKSELEAAGFSAPVSGISIYERRMLVGRISGCYDPIVTRDFFDLPFKTKIRYAGSLASTFLKRLLDRKKDCGSAFRPSTGVLALVLAIDEYGPDAEYVMAGIGLRKRAEYLNGKRRVRRALPAHVYADSHVLGKLVRRYSLYTTEPELFQLLPSLR